MPSTTRGLSTGPLMAFFLATGMVAASACAQAELPEGEGLAAKYPGDAGIDQDPDVVFVENFEQGSLEGVKSRWGFGRFLDVMALVDDVPEHSAGQRSLRMTASPSREGVELYKAFDEGWDAIFLRFDVKFADDYGQNHHFVALRGYKDPEPWPMGGSSARPEDGFSVTIEPSRHYHNLLPEDVSFSPPGNWNFYAYWPEMRSWQTPSGDTDGRPSPYYGNGFSPDQPQIVERGRWSTMEIMVKMNSTPDSYDGELALWVDGERAAHFYKGGPEGYFQREKFRVDPDHPDAEPFEGFRWRKDMDVNVNVLRLQNYVSERTFNSVARYVEEHPDFQANTEEATVHFDDVVMATQYIGPIVAED